MRSVLHWARFLLQIVVKYGVVVGRTALEQDRICYRRPVAAETAETSGRIVRTRNLPSQCVRPEAAATRKRSRSLRSDR